VSKSHKSIENDKTMVKRMGGGGGGDEQTHTKNPPKHRKLKQEEHERQNLTRTHLLINLSNMSQINRIMR
jgi:hypothetical protein